MPKKPVLATSQELDEAEARLNDAIKKVQGGAAEALSGSEKRSGAALGELKNQVEDLGSKAADSVASARSEAKSYTEECIKLLNDQLQEMFPPIETRITEVDEDIRAKVEDVDTKLQQLIVDELSGLAAQFDEELQTMKKEFAQTQLTWGRQAAEALVTQKKQLDHSIEQLRLSCAEDRQRIREEAKAEFESTVAKQHVKDSEQDQERQRQRGEIEDQFQKVAELISEKEAKAALELERAVANAAANLAGLDDKSHQHLVQLDGETQQLRDGLREVENVQTRRVEWVIKNASLVIRPEPGGWTESKKHRSWFSPQFNGAGLYGMQLELQMYGPPGKNESGRGNLGVFLWACKGATVAAKLYIGERAMPVEKRFNGRSPCGTNRFCWLRDQINTEDDTLRVGIEFLEAMREVDCPIKPPAAIDGEIDGATKAFDALEGLESSVPSQKLTGLEGSICAQRHINNRVIDQVQSQLKGIKSQMVRKIEWLVQNASSLRENVKWGEAMCSPRFDAAGIEGMQFALYPSGYGSNVTEGFCSLFLYGPAGASLHCFLTMASQAREINHYFEEAGAYGRTNFCLFDKCISLQDDTILITLEIEDAKQDMSTPWTHQESGARDPESHKAGAPSKDLSSILKLTKNPGKGPCGAPNGRSGKLDSVMQLPSIWTPKNFVESDEQTNADVPEGFHTFAEVRTRRPMAARPESPANKPKSPKAKSLGTGGMRKNESAPALREQGTRTAMEEDLSPPLPPASAGSITLGYRPGSRENELPVDASSMGKTRKVSAPRHRPGSSGGLGASMTRLGS